MRHSSDPGVGLPFAVSAKAAKPGSQVKVRQHLDGTLSLFHGPRCIARYGPEGQALALAA
jgi:hypothetical protein